MEHFIYQINYPKPVHHENTIFRTVSKLVDPAILWGVPVNSTEGPRQVDGVSANLTGSPPVLRRVPRQIHGGQARRNQNLEGLKVVNLSSCSCIHDNLCKNSTNQTIWSGLIKRSGSTGTNDLVWSDQTMQIVVIF